MLDRDNPSNRPTAVQALGDITFFQYPFKDREEPLLSSEKPIHNIIQCRNSTIEGEEEITYWALDMTGNVVELEHSTLMKYKVPTKHVAIHDRVATESDIPVTANDEKGQKYIFELWNCHITTDFFKSLYDQLDLKRKIAKLKIAHMKPGSISELMEMICTFVRKWTIRSLSLEHDHLDDDDIDLIYKFQKTHFYPLDELDISCNKDITSTGFQKVGEFVSQFYIRAVLATACDVTDEKLEKFLEGAKHINKFGFKSGYGVNELNLSCNPNLTTRGYAKLARFVAAGRVRRLKLSGCELTEKIVDEFYEQLPSQNLELLEELDVSYNPGITASTKFGQIIVKCGIKKLNLAGCECDAEHLARIMESTPQYKLDTMCLKDNSTISGGLSQLAELVKHWHIKELDISDCLLSAFDLKFFRKKLDGAMLKILYLGDKVRESDASCMEEIVNLLSNVTDVLELQLHKMNCNFPQLLLKHTGRFPSKVLVRFSDGSVKRWDKYTGYGALVQLKRDVNTWNSYRKLVHKR